MDTNGYLTGMDATRQTTNIDYCYNYYCLVVLDSQDPAVGGKVGLSVLTGL